MVASPWVVSKEMAVTHADFFRLIGAALGTDAYQRNDTGVVYEDGEKRISIQLGPEGWRNIALLHIPATMVTLTFDGFDDGEATTRLADFDRAFQRGGG